MKLSYVSISHFRCFPNQTEIDLTDIYTGLANDRLVLVGTNASGKTSLIETTISLINAAYNTKDSLYEDLLTKQAAVTVQFLDDKDNKISITLQNNELSTTGNLELLPKYLYFPAERYLSLLPKDTQNLEEYNFGYKYLASKDTPLFYLDKGLPDLALKFFSGRDLIYTKDRGFALEASANDPTLIPLEKLPSGEKQALILLTLIEEHLQPGSLVFIDEFELSLHPTAQRRLYQLLSNYLKEKNCQLIIATHSIEIVRASSETEVFSLDVYSGGAKN